MCYLKAIFPHICFATFVSCKLSACVNIWSFPQTRMYVLAISNPRLITDQQIVTLLIYTKPLITLSIFILYYTKPILLVSQLLRLLIAHCLDIKVPCMHKVFSNCSSQDLQFLTIGMFLWPRLTLNK